MKGFTLVEAMIVVVILGICAAMVVPLLVKRCGTVEPSELEQNEINPPHYLVCVDQCSERFMDQAPLTACIEGCGNVYQ